MRVAIGCDQAGSELKDAVRQQLETAGAEIVDHSPDPALDYPDVAEQVARAVASGKAERGVLMCGTGIGMAIAANKVEGIRAALCPDPYSARMSREHNDANVLCLGGRTIGPGAAAEILRAWLDAQPSMEERHVRRRAKVAALTDAQAPTVQVIHSERPVQRRPSIGRSPRSSAVADLGATCKVDPIVLHNIEQIAREELSPLKARGLVQDVRIACEEDRVWIWVVLQHKLDAEAQYRAGDLAYPCATKLSQRYPFVALHFHVVEPSAYSREQLREMLPERRVLSVPRSGRR